MTHPAGDPTSATLETLGRDTLYRIIGAVAKGPDLERVLPPVVELISDATDCHACFVYLLEDGSLRMRAASRIYAEAVGKVVLGLDEGLTGWVARHATPAFIRENAMQDPRMKHVPELDEEHFQSMLAVPLFGDAGDVIGVVVLHTEAPREFGQEVLDFVVHTASLVAGAIDNARLYDRTRLQVAALSELVEVGQRIAGAEDRAALYSAALDGTGELLGRSRCRLYLLTGDDERLQLVAGEAGDAEPQPVLAALRGGAGERIMGVRVRAAGHDIGALVAERDHVFTSDDERLFDAVAHQMGVALQRMELIERLTEKNTVRDLFTAWADGHPELAAARASAAGLDLSLPYVVVHAGHTPAGAAGWAELSRTVEQHLRRLHPGTLCDPGPESVRALLPLSGDAEGQLIRIDAEFAELSEGANLTIGRGALRRRLRDDSRSPAEAAHAARVAGALHPTGGVCGYESLGVYRYLSDLPGGSAPDERHAHAVAAIVAYDRERHTQLFATLERYLGGRDGIVATARSLFVHPNTLRQRLERIEQVTGLSLADEDLLSLELALKLGRLTMADVDT